MALSENEILILTRLLGAREFVAAADAEAAAVTRVGEASEMTGRRFETAGRRGFLLNQTLFTMRRLVYGVSLGMLAGGIQAFRWGFQFNSAMQTARVALKPFFNDQTDLNNALQRLWNIAKFTPFQIRDMTLAFRALYPAMAPLGITADETIDSISAIINGLSVAGKVSGPSLQRATIALQHMAFQGHLTGITVNQLARDGIPIFAILQKELGLNAEQMHQIGKMGIPANVAMRAMIHYLTTMPGYAGAATRQAHLTLEGIWSTFKDNMSALMGGLEKGMFARLQVNLNRANLWFNQFTRTVRSSTSVSDFLDRAIGPHAVFVWDQFTAAARNAWQAIRTIVGDLMRSKVVWGTIIAALIILRGSLWFVARNGDLIATTLKVILPLWIAWHTYIKIATLWNGYFTASEVAMTEATSALKFQQFLLAIVMGRYQIATRIATTLTWLFNTALIETALSGWTLSTAIAAAQTRLALLRLSLLGLSGMVVAAAIVVDLIFNKKDRAKFFNELKAGPGSHTASLGQSLADKIGFGDWRRRGGLNQYLPGFLGGHATGGSVWPGWSMVGENGPELLNYSTRQVMPAQQSAGPVEAWRQRQGDLRPLVVQVMLDKRVVAEAVTDVLATAGARA